MTKFFKDLKKLIGIDNELPEGYYGAVDDYSEEDYQLCAGVLDLPKPRNGFPKKQIQYQQTEVSSVSCTVHGAMGAVSDLTGYVFTLEQRKAIWAEAIRRGANPAKGWSVNSAVDLVRNWWNKNKPIPNITLQSYRVVPGSEEYTDAILRGYSVVVGYYGDAAYNRDLEADGDIDGLKFSKAYGHCVRATEYTKSLYSDMIVDNYPVSRPKTNLYTIPDKNIAPLKKNGVLFVGAYVFAIFQDMPEYLSKVSPWALKSVEKAKAKGIMIYWDNPQEELAPANSTLEWTLYNLKALTKTGTPVTKERLACAYDTLGLLD